jgi:hypothetical protein
LKGWAIVKEDAAPTGVCSSPSGWERKITLTRPTDTLSRPTGEGRGEGFSFFGFGSTNMPRRRRWGRTPCQNHFALDVWGIWRLNLTCGFMNNTFRSPQDAFENHLAQFCAPIGWLPSLDAPSLKLKCKTGTCALIDTGEIRVFVTCDHVWTQWRKYKDKHSKAVLLIGLDDGVPLILTDPELVDSNRDWDIAVIKAEISPHQLRTKAFWQIDEWPITQPKVGDVVAITGFSANVRTLSSGSITGWGIAFLGRGVSSVRSDKIILAPENNDRENSFPIGGMSGSPAYLLKEKGKPALVGFLYEGNTSDNFIFLTPAHFLQPNGKLNEPPGACQPSETD